MKPQFSLGVKSLKLIKNNKKIYVTLFGSPMTLLKNENAYNFRGKTLYLFDATEIISDC